MRTLTLYLFALLAFVASSSAFAATTTNPCPRPAIGSVVAPPADLFSVDGFLNVTLNYYTALDDANRTLFCFVTADGVESPTLHVQPGDTLRITLKNQLPTAPSSGMAIEAYAAACGSEYMTNSSVNMHFHGVNARPICHSDETVRTLVNSGDTFTYSVKFPADEPPGLYWYHPHVHGLADNAVEGGATGVIVVDGIEKVQPKVAGLPERVLVLRDQRLRVPALFQTPGSAKPSWDISVNYVPIEYPAYVPAQMQVPVGRKEFWRVANTSADTIVDVDLSYDGVKQPLEIVALDGVPVGSQDGSHRGKTFTVNHIQLPPAGRAEFIVTMPGAGVKKALFETGVIDNGPAGDNDLPRPIALLVAQEPKPVAALGVGVKPTPAALPTLPLATEAPGPQRFEGIDASPVKTRRKLYLTEESVLGQNGSGEFPVNFYITVEGQTPKLYSSTDPPAIVTTQGAVEEWTIENRTQEVHEFHIHQIHYQVRKINGVPVPPEQRQFYDTFPVPYWTGTGPYPSITVAMDFRGDIAGDFLYHCHILGHEDGGMMARIRVLPRRD